MHDITPILELEREIKLAGFSVAQICRAASVDPVTFLRWKRGKHGANLTKLGQVRAALSDAKLSSDKHAHHENKAGGFA